MFKLFAGGVLAASEAFPENRLTVKGGRFLTLNTVIRVNQIEAARDVSGLRAVSTAVSGWGRSSRIAISAWRKAWPK